MPTVGDVVDNRYRLDAHLGDGTYGDVYKAWDLNQETTVALKVLKPTVPRAAMVWHKEAARLTDVRGDHLLTIRNASQASGYPYIAMDLVDGSVDDHTPPTGLPPREVVRVMHQAATGIARIHDAELLHCDIKPANLFIDGQTIRVGDLGLATKIGGPSHNDCTPATMAPEVAAANLAHSYTGVPQPGRNSVASDVYSLGATAYQLATGRYPHEVTSGVVSLDDYYDMIVTDDPPRVIDVAPHVPPLLGRHIEKAIAKNITDRWDDPADFAAALASLTLHEPVWERTDQHGNVHGGCWQAAPPGRATLAVCLTPNGSKWDIDATRNGRQHKKGIRTGLSDRQRLKQARSAMRSF